MMGGFGGPVDIRAIRGFAAGRGWRGLRRNDGKRLNLAVSRRGRGIQSCGGFFARSKTTFSYFFPGFSFPTFFGLLQSEWPQIDELQTYLIGLKCYTTGTWPAFGPDAAGSESSFQSQIPGALEGLVIALPLYLFHQPEAPFILLNLMGSLGVLLLAWYIFRKIPGLSYPWLCLWITVAPWSIHEATHIYNVSYVFLPSILFFIGFMESLPSTSLDLVSPFWANFLMGLSVFWIQQFHLSYVYLLPLSLYSMAAQLRKKKELVHVAYFGLGSLIPLVFLVPTVLQYGFNRVNSHSGFYTGFNFQNFLALPVLLARFLSLVSFELPRFIGAHNSERMAFLKSHLEILFPGVLLWAIGLLQPFLLLFAWFKRDHPLSTWAKMKELILAIFGMIWISFWFTIKQPLSHIYFIFFPFLMAYSCYVWVLFAGNRRWAWAAKAFLLLGLYFQVGYAVAVAPRDSLYSQRALVAKAIEEKNYHLLGERRAGSFY